MNKDFTTTVLYRNKKKALAGTTAMDMIRKLYLDDTKKLVDICRLVEKAFGIRLETQIITKLAEEMGLPPRPKFRNQHT
jgi:hypothetical protein